MIIEVAHVCRIQLVHVGSVELFTKEQVSALLILLIVRCTIIATMQIMFDVRRIFDSIYRACQVISRTCL